MYSFTSTVRYSECDANRNLSIPALVNYLQDCSTFHSETIGHGIDHNDAMHIAWFIAAWQIEIVRLPRFGENITISTACYALNATRANRNFMIADEDGNPLVRADSIWVVFDTVAGRSVRIPAGEQIYVEGDERLDMPPTKRKLVLRGEGEALSPIPVTEQHLDTNHHVNNGQYVAMAGQIISARDASFAPAHLYVQYKTAAKLGDVIVPRLHVEENGYAIDLANEDGDTFAIVRMTRD